MSDPAGRLAGKVAFVTGAGSGIGRATAIRLAAEGARVACADVVGADTTAASIAGEGHDADGYVVDVTDYESVAAAVDSTIAASDGIDIVCNIAGIGHFAWSHEETPEAFDRVVKVNLNGSFHVCRAALPSLLERKGVIINTASNTGLMGAPWSAAYCASKGGVIQLTKALAREYNSHGLRVNADRAGRDQHEDHRIVLDLPGRCRRQGAVPDDLAVRLRRAGGHRRRLRLRRQRRSAVHDRVDHPHRWRAHGMNGNVNDQRQSEKSSDPGHIFGG